MTDTVGEWEDIISVVTDVLTDGVLPVSVLLVVLAVSVVVDSSVVETVVDFTVVVDCSWVAVGEGGELLVSRVVLNTVVVPCCEGVEGELVVVGEGEGVSGASEVEAVLPPRVLT